MSEFQLCACGSAPGYPHRKDCPRPLYNPTDSQFEQWEKEWLAKKEQLNMKTQHTPTPYVVTHQNLCDQDWDIISEQVSGGICVATCGRSADPNSQIAVNARFIVKACNCHEDLLEARKFALKYHQMREAKQAGSGFPSQLRDALKAAIAKAQE